MKAWHYLVRVKQNLEGNFVATAFAQEFRIPPRLLNQRRQECERTYVRNLRLFTKRHHFAKIAVRGLCLHSLDELALQAFLALAGCRAHTGERGGPPLELLRHGCKRAVQPARAPDTRSGGRVQASRAPAMRLSIKNKGTYHALILHLSCTYLDLYCTYLALIMHFSCAYHALILHLRSLY